MVKKPKPESKPAEPVKAELERNDPDSPFDMTDDAKDMLAVIKTTHTHEQLNDMILKHFANSATHSRFLYDVWSDKTMNVGEKLWGLFCLGRAVGREGAGALFMNAVGKGLVSPEGLKQIRDDMKRSKGHGEDHDCSTCNEEDCPAHGSKGKCGEMDMYKKTKRSKLDEQMYR